MSNICSECNQECNKDNQRCYNNLCESQSTDICPVCNKFGDKVGDAECFFSCEDSHGIYVWSYHYGCENTKTRCSREKGVFLGFIKEPYGKSAGSMCNCEEDDNCDHDDYDEFVNPQESPRLIKTMP